MLSCYPSHFGLLSWAIRPPNCQEFHAKQFKDQEPFRVLIWCALSLEDCGNIKNVSRSGLQSSSSRPGILAVSAPLRELVGYPTIDFGNPLRHWDPTPVDQSTLMPYDAWLILIYLVKGNAKVFSIFVPPHHLAEVRALWVRGSLYGFSYSN